MPQANPPTFRRVRLDEECSIEERLTLLHVISEVLIDSPSLADAAPRILNAIGERLDVKIGAIWQLDNKTQCLRCLQVWKDVGFEANDFEKMTHELSFHVGEGIPGSVWQTLQPLCMADVTQFPNFPRREPAQTAGLHACIATPVMYGGNFLGVIEFFATSDQTPNENWGPVFAWAGKQIGHFSEKKTMRDDLEATRKKLEEVNQLQRAVLDGNTYAIISVSPDGIIQTFSAGAERMLGYSREELVGQQLPDIFHDKEEVIKRAAELSQEYGRTVEPGMDSFTVKVQNGGEYTREWTYIRKDGHRFPVMLSITSLRDMQNNIVGYMGIARDITQEKIAEQQLQKNQRDMSWLVHDMREYGIYMLDPKGNVMSWNTGAELIKGYTAEEILGRNFSIFYTPEDIEAKKPERLLQTAEKDGRLVDEGWRVRKDGSRFWARVVITAWKSETGELMGFSKITNDLTESKLNEQALERSRKDVDNLKKSLDEHAIVAITDRQGRIVYVNDKFCAISKYSREELLGRTHKIINSGYHSKEFFHDFWTTIGHGKVWHGEIKNRAKDGSTYWVDSTIVPFMGEDGKPEQYVAIRQDITKRKELEEQLLVARDHALKISQLKSQFLANMSHEIRTPMNGVLGMNGLLLASKLNPEQRHMAELVQNSAESLMTIISDILDFSKIEAGKFTIDMADVNLQPMVEDAVVLMAPRAHAKGVQLSSEFVGDFDRLLEGDGGRIRQILLNLLSNALKYTEEGEVQVKVTSTQMPGNQRRVRFEVRDTGIGIPEEAQSRLFQPFSQVQANPARNFGGTGLGLAISRQLVDLMGGEIGVKSAVGEGSTFWFELSMNALEPVPQSPDMKLPPGLRILVMDDNATNRRIMVDQLQSLGAEVAAAENSALAMERLVQAAAARLPFEVALLDWDVPGINGMDLARLIRGHKQLSGMKLLLSSSMNHAKEQDEYRDVRMDGVMMKPIRKSQLYENIMRALRTNTADFYATPTVTLPPVIAELPSAQVTSSGLCFLVAEDNPTNQVVAQKTLESIGHQVEVVPNGAEALKALAGRHFDAVLMDCQMPVLDGYTTTQRIRAGGLQGVSPKIPVIGLTAYAGAEDRQNCLAAGMDDYISKPLRVKDLNDALSRHNLRPKEAALLPPRPPEAEALDAEQVAQLHKLPGKNGGSLLTEIHTALQMEIPRALETLRKLYDQKEWAEWQRLLHKVAGSASSIGALGLRRAALNAETSAREANYSALAGLLMQVEKEWQKLDAQLKRINEENRGV